MLRRSAVARMSMDEEKAETEAVETVGYVGGSGSAGTGPLCRHNMRYGVLHGAGFHMATAFADPYAVIPLFLAGFTESRALVGLVVSLVGAVGVVPQLGMSRKLRRNPADAKMFMLVAIWTRCGMWGLIALIALLMSVQSVWILIVFMCLISIYSLGGGIAVLPFKQVVTETIAPDRRSTFFGRRLLIGGILAVLAGAVVAQVLGSDALVWPRNYGILFGLSFVSLAAAYTAMSQLRFAHRSGTAQDARLRPLHKEVASTFKEYPILKRLIAVRLLSGGLPLVFPFLTLYATRELHISLAWVGVYVAARQAGGILSNLGWMPMGDRLGTRAVILAGLALAVVSFAAILVSKSAIALAVAFGLAGGGMSAMIVGFSGYILELGTPELRPLLFALEDTLLMPLYFMPLLGGFLVDGYGYRPTLLVGGSLLVAAFVCACALCEPRRGDAACGPCSPSPQGNRAPEPMSGQEDVE